MDYQMLMKIKWRFKDSGERERVIFNKNDFWKRNLNSLWAEEKFGSFCDGLKDLIGALREIWSEIDEILSGFWLKNWLRNDENWEIKKKVKLEIKFLLKANNW